MITRYKLENTKDFCTRIYTAIEITGLFGGWWLSDIVGNGIGWKVFHAICGWLYILPKMVALIAEKLVS